MSLKLYMMGAFPISMILQWEVVPADEGSARGAALIAAVAEKLNL